MEHYKKILHPIISLLFSFKMVFMSEIGISKSSNTYADMVYLNSMNRPRTTWERIVHVMVHVLTNCWKTKK